MMIFDGFPSREQADAFAAEVRRLQPDRTTTVYDSVDEAQAADPFPFHLQAPVVHVSRHYDEDLFSGETEIEELAPEYGGTFAGT